MRASAQLESLTAINVQDFLESLGLDEVSRGRAALEAASWLPARRFARRVIRFDNHTGKDGLRAAAREALKGFCRKLEISGAEFIPKAGPVLILSNHPGISDTLAMFASIHRTDLKIVAGDRPFLRSLPNVSQRLIYVPDEGHGRMEVVRTITGHLRSGGAVLTFPAGKIEPDPAFMPGAAASLKDWSKSIALLIRLVPQTILVPALVSGVVLPSTLTHPFTIRRPAGRPREKMAASLQILEQTLFPWTRRGTVKVQFGSPIPAQSLADCGDAEAITNAVTEHTARLIQKLKAAG
jgi:hypothetical protein